MKNILIIEDERTLARGLAHELKHAGSAVEVCYSGAMAENALMRIFFDLMLLDVNLLEEDGFQLYRRIKKL